MIRSSSWRNLVNGFGFEDIAESRCSGRIEMATNKPTGDNARKGAVKKRSQTKTTMGGATTWTKRDKASGEFLAIKRGKKDDC
jgi:hypothetical protein